MLAAWGLDTLAPIGALPSSGWLGAVVGLAAILLFAAALRHMRRHRTDVRPDKPTTALVTQGPFGWTRNPIYLGFGLVVLGAAIAWGSLWAWLALPLTLVLLDRLVIAREEPYLARLFGPAFATYRSGVRRWV
jgi:protein-S-isoprenylcysteine O-methyltransferase Ste14